MTGYRNIFALLLTAVLAACSSTSALELARKERRLALLEDKESRKKRAYLKRTHLCERMMRKLRPTLEELLPHRRGHSKGLYDDLLAYSADDCKGVKRSRLFALLRRWLDQPTERIGVILPLSGPRAHLGKAVLSGMRVAAEGLGISFDQLVRIRDSQSMVGELRPIMADLIFRHQISMLVVGLEDAPTAMASRLSKRMMLPTLQLSPSQKILSTNPYSFQIYPPQRALARHLAREAEERNIRSVAIMQPSDGRSEALIEAFREALELEDISSTVFPYESGVYTSMEQAARALAGIDMVKRFGEYQSLYRKKREEARVKGARFDPRQVILSPRVEHDAIFLPDDFRILHHFINLFRYHNIPKVTLIGSHHWRAKELVQPWDSFLKGAFFADFIGAYHELPSGVAPPESGHFVEASSLIPIDFKTIGYRTMSIAGEIARLRLPHKKIRKTLAGHESVDPYIGKAFRKDRSSSWQTFLFKVGGEGELQISEPRRF